MKSWATNLTQRDWGSMALHMVVKNFYDAHPITKDRNMVEVDQFWKEHQIDITGTDDIPKPQITGAELAFPDWLNETFRSQIGVEAPTPIQAQVWPLALQGRDVIGIAETGSGKTLAYVLPALVHIIAQEELKSEEGPICVVLVPTRELAFQIEKVCKIYSGRSGVSPIAITGGRPCKDDEWALQEIHEIIIATPGRFIALLNRSTTNLLRCTYVVLDEADNMLDQGFKDQIDMILDQVRPDRQMLMFSATWKKEVQELANKHFTNTETGGAVTVRVGGDKLAAAKRVKQQFMWVEGDNVDDQRWRCLKLALKKAEETPNGSKYLIFCRSKQRVDELHEKLKESNYEVACIHSGLSQEDRMRAYNTFRTHPLAILVATDLFERGHDIPKVRYVVNYDCPLSAESYVHRVGRTGRAGNHGYALTFISAKDHMVAASLAEIAKLSGFPIPEKMEALAKGGAGAWGAKDDEWGDEGWWKTAEQEQPASTADGTGNPSSSEGRCGYGVLAGDTGLGPEQHVAGNAVRQ